MSESDQPTTSTPTSADKPASSILGSSAGSRPIGPSSTDFDNWLNMDDVGQAMKQRIEADHVTEAAAYQIWRDAWMACEIAHGIRKTLNGRDGKFLFENK